MLPERHKKCPRDAAGGGTVGGEKVVVPILGSPDSEFKCRLGANTPDTAGGGT